MKLNQNSHFSMTPAAVNMQRSVLDRSSELLTTFDAANIVPIYLDEVLPGDSVKMKVSAIIRMTTSIHATMDRAYDDIYFFFVPNRLVWENWEEFCGENPNPWITNQPSHQVPQITLAATDTVIGSIFNYMGIPLGYAGDVNALPFRAYNKIFNDWWRNTNLQSELALVEGDTGDNVSGQAADYYYKVRKATKFKDYFTSALPSPQRGPDVDIPLGQSAPVFGTGKQLAFATASTNDYPLRITKGSGAIASGGSQNALIYNSSSSSTDASAQALRLLTKTEANNVSQAYADLSQATAATINQLRLAFQTQKFYERMGIATGGRYVSVLKTMFGVTSPDYRLQRSEYLGGSRSLINMSQVTQSSETSTTPLGTVAGQSVTRLSNHLFHKGFTEHGFIIGVSVVRTKHTYQYGIDKLFSRKNLLDYYWPTFAFIGEQPIKNKEIYAQGASVVDAQGNVVDEQVFGYQEAWAEYRYKPNKLNGYFQSSASGTLDSWHYGDKYTGLPTLGNNWIEETDANIKRTLAVQAGVHQFIAHFAFDCKHTRVMPVYSVPGLIDHF